MEEYPDRKTAVIAAKVTGPGPGRYNLPPTVGFVSHDYTKFSSPAYSFHGRPSNSAHVSDSSPGPRYYVDASLTRFGRSAGPSYSMLARGRSADKKNDIPGPGTYSPEKCTVPTQRKFPSYSMGSRTRYRSMDRVPAPNSYSLPPVLGPRATAKVCAPAFTLSGKYQHGGHSEDLSGTPGPAHYQQTDPSRYLKRGPAFSMQGRQPNSKAEQKTPGPGSYYPEKVNQHKRHAPAYSMGIRHSEYTAPLIIEVPI
ncbi:hypothetical protein XENTR_v10001431 [Xenopus tropicalis]|uniref:Outer dense fiber of sperm tails 3-like 1 n=1 Tax=Xenopus tropicalis TaxID=8364 RepID=F7BVB4_XENTR|nr:outer dense fiber protein 3-like protein 2 [Xenopus tropicalis]KAE8632104.1 hypothetical protein XENTR_v10001431 [Xenopus tropicalis]KAE8632105.1 hypothetical protein XENTR_v10001431 [Xenopus tropicalis]KAE8632106.1 hypothetical protein XENTR_v10001431 [Xenopus tropicalis]KAE8632107.1 hypothetical protein XENTR_v10001431 [Xenopus tropicalis]